jgi:hypothetical protein
MTHDEILKLDIEEIPKVIKPYNCDLVVDLNDDSCSLVRGLKLELWDEIAKVKSSNTYNKCVYWECGCDDYQYQVIIKLVKHSQKAIIEFIYLPQDYFDYC